jgi:hypothetical protein
MNTLQILFGEFWPTFVGMSVFFSFVWLAPRLACDGYLPFISPKSFPELATFAKDEQKGLLHEASKEASSQWRSFVPTVVFVALFSFGVAVGHTLPKVSALPDSFWVHVVFDCLFAVVGFWLAGRLTAQYMRPFLKRYIESTSQAG